MSTLMEHEPSGASPSSQDKGAIYVPTDEERELLKKCDALFQKAKKARSKADSEWIDYYKLFRGKQWKEQRPSYRASEVFNIIWQIIQSTVPIIVDAKPKFEYLPQEPGDRQFADLMNDICEADWSKNNWLYQMTEVVYDATLYGTGLSGLRWCPNEDKIIYESTSPFYMFPDPAARSFKQDCLFVCHAAPEDITKIKRLFPEYEQFIKPDVVDFVSDKKVDLSTSNIGASIDQIYESIRGNLDSSNQNSEVLVKTFYLEDDEVLEEETENPETGELETISRIKYPGGRKVVIANGVVLYNGETGYDDDCKFPYQRFTNYVLPRNFWGISECESLASPQRTFNRLVSYAMDCLLLMGNPIWVVDVGSGVDTDNLVNAPGSIVEKNPGTEVRREAGVQLQPYVLQLIDKVKEWVDQISGSQDITRGNTPSGVTAAGAIADLQAAAQTRIRLKSKNLDAYLQDLGQAYVSRVLQFYTAPQVFRLTGKDGTEKYFKMSIQKTQDGQGHQALVQNFTDNQLLNPTPEIYQLRGKLDVRVVTGSSLPFSKTQNENRAYQLFDRGIIDSEEVLKSLDYPNWEAIQQRMQEQAAAAAQAQAAQGQPPPQAA